MKHTLPVTLILIGVFVLSQLFGLFLVSLNSDLVVVNGKVVVTHADTALGARPETTGFGSLTYLLVGILVGTIVLLILIRFKLINVWRLWFFVAVWMAITVALGAMMPTWLAFVVALGLAAWKIFKPNIIVHNITEVLVYAGIALLVVPLFDIVYVSILMLIIAAYDAYAVWRSKHMVKMAQFQTETKLFAGLLIPYQTKTVKLAKQPSLNVKPVEKPTGGKSAILGGGDIAFPLLFCGVVFDSLLQSGFSKLAAYGYSLIVVAGAAAALTLLFVYAKKDRFYPAIPYLAAGCFIGYGVLRLVLLI